MARPDKYSECVEPYLKDIEEMALYMSEKQIAESLGIADSTFREHKKKYPALQAALKKGRQKLVKELKSKLISKAMGMQYTETKTITDNTGYERTEKVVKTAPPDLGSIHLLLKNYDSENWAEDPNALKLKREELELKKKMAEERNWK